MEETMNANSSVMSIHPMLLLRELMHRLGSVIAAAILAAVCAYIIVSATFVPKFETTTTFVASSRTSSASVFSNLNATTSFAESFSTILNSDVMRKYIADDMKVSSVDGEINATAIAETNIIELKVSANSQREAYLITRSLINNYERLSGKLLNEVSLEVLKAPSVPVSPVNSSGAEKISLLAGLAGAAAMIAFVFVRAILRDTVKTEEEVEKKLDTKLLTTVYHEHKYKTLKSALKRKKTSILITNPTTGFAFVETFKKLRTKLEYYMRKDGVKTIMVTSVMEDEGKSTVAANIALAMGRKYKNVLLIDADLRKPAIHKILDYQNKKYATLEELVTGKATLKQALVVDRERKIQCIVGRKNIFNTDGISDGELMRSFMASAAEHLDVVIIDTPPMSVGPDAEFMAELVDAAVLVVRQDTAPACMINDAIDALSESGTKVLGCVFNNVRAADINDNYNYGYGGKYGYDKYGYGESDKGAEKKK